jgi:hypothetical protein
MMFTADKLIMFRSLPGLWEEFASRERDSVVPNIYLFLIFGTSAAAFTFAAFSMEAHPRFSYASAIVHPATNPQISIQKVGITSKTVDLNSLSRGSRQRHSGGMKQRPRRSGASRCSDCIYGMQLFKYSSSSVKAINMD